MARIDLKDAVIRIKDGYVGAAAVNNGGGYAAGTTVMTINGAPAAAIPDNASFTIPGSNRIHTVTTATGGPPSTSITFTPALQGAVIDTAVITFAGRALEVNIGEGDLSYVENKERIYERNKGNLSDVREGDEQPVEVTFAFTWEEITAVSGGTPTIEDVFKNRGEAASWVSSDSDPCQPFAVDIEIEHIPSCTTKEREIVLLPDFRYEQLEHSYEDATVASTGRCNVTEATVTRLSNT